MQITIDNTKIDTLEGETILEAARRSGIAIPSMCYAKDANHKSSCMVCAVKNKGNGQIIPSCTTIPWEGMEIESDTDEVKQIRIMSLNLLLSDHRADCVAPCSLVCPYGLDVERMLYFYDKNQYKESFAIIHGAFSLPQLGCEVCKAPCEKACRRGSVDKPVAIREIIKEVAGMYSAEEINPVASEKMDKKAFSSKLGQFTDKERIYLQEKIKTKSGCLHCACAGKENCKLRLYSNEYGIKRTPYGSDSKMQVMRKIHVKDSMWFEPAKCIRCGLCVYNSKNGFTFKDRGFGMEVILPKENNENVGPDLIKLCPTGALYLEG